MTDVEMKPENGKEEKKEETVKEGEQPEEPSDLFYELKKSLVLLEEAAKEHDARMTSSLTKNFKKLRKLYTLPDTLLVLKHYLNDLFSRLALPCQPTELQAGESIEDKLHTTSARATQMAEHAEI